MVDFQSLPNDLMHSVTTSVLVFPADSAYLDKYSYTDASRRNTTVRFGSLLLGRPAPGLRPPRFSFLFMFRDFLKQFDRLACGFQRIDESV